MDRSEAVRRYLAGPQVPATPRYAATVLVLRDGSEGPEVFMLRRHRRMAFGPGVYVFPGGSVEDADHVDEAHWAGPPPTWWSRHLAVPPRLAESLLCAAVRETFEECGVLFAGTERDSSVSAAGTAWDAERTQLACGRVSLQEVLARHGLLMRTDLLRATARWVTPIFSPRRFDTQFFMAALPTGARCRDFGEESDDSCWIPVRRALHAYEQGEMPMMLATADALNALLPFGDVAGALAQVRPATTPRIVRAVDRHDGFEFVVDGLGEAVGVDDYLVAARGAVSS